MRSQGWKLARLATPVLLVPLFACMGPPIETPLTRITQEKNILVNLQQKDKVDILFMVDDSTSTLQKQKQLHDRFQALIQVLDDFKSKGTPAWYHIGVVTSSLGAGSSTCITSNGVSGDDGGRLWGAPKDPMPVMLGSGFNCNGFKLSGSFRFIDYNQKDPTAIPNTNGASIADAFGCISDVGASGCGFEHQLESVYRALHDRPKENDGFLRRDAILAVIWVTDEDDCSMPPTSTMGDPNASSTWGLYHSFRCTAYGIGCDGGPVDPMNGKTYNNCVSMPINNGLTDIQKYIDFFTLPAAKGGIKIDPNDVILGAIAAPPTPFATSIFTCDVPSMPTCLQLNHSCGGPTTQVSSPGAFVGDPAVRIWSVVNAAPFHSEMKSICDSDYNDALTKIGQLITSKIQPGCLDAPVLARAADGSPDCIIEDVRDNGDGTFTTTEVKWCPNNQPGDGTSTCWRLQDRLDQYTQQGCGNTPPDPACTLPPSCQPVLEKSSGQMQLYGITVDRDQSGVPSNTHLQVACATLASKS